MAESEISKTHIDDIGKSARQGESAVAARLGEEAIDAMRARGGCDNRGGSSVGDNGGRKHHGPILYPLPDVDIHVTVNANPGEVRPGKRVQ